MTKALCVQSESANPFDASGVRFGVGTWHLTSNTCDAIPVASFTNTMPARAYEIVPGFFIQDDPSAVSTVIGPTPEFFGLISKSWPDFADEINKLNANSSESVSYKVFFLGRHGEGYHNVAEVKYGQKAWDEKWALLDGDGELTWAPDPHLTAIGEDQARTAHAAWERELLQGASIPQKFYCSPLRRALRTLELTFEGTMPAGLKPVILENCREEYGEHTCDKRRTKSEIQADFPGFIFEDGFEEEDLLWTLERESKESACSRAKLVLDRIFENDVEDISVGSTRCYA
ncbi:histidine phosphatase superfamily [Gloeopeniophorella convolvens]|nr:histidine phosphatase superfamily [Gloeopeniophorella convolvens]